MKHKRGNFSRKYKQVDRRPESAPISKENVGVVGGLNKNNNNWKIVIVVFDGPREKIDVDDFKMFVNEKLEVMTEKNKDISFNSFNLSHDNSVTIEFNKEPAATKMLKLHGGKYKDYTLNVRRPYDFNREKKDNYRSESRDYNSRIRNRDPDNNYRSESRDSYKKRYKIKGIEDEYGNPKRKHRQHRPDRPDRPDSRPNRDRDRDSLSKKKKKIC